MLLELEQYKNNPMPVCGFEPMNPLNIQPVKDEPDVFVMDQHMPIYQMPFTNMPPASTNQPGQLPSFDAAWGGPSTSYGITTPNIPLVPEATMTFTDMDSLKQITINSDDLPVTSFTNMSITEFATDGMTDSLDRLANTEVDKHLLH